MSLSLPIRCTQTHTRVHMCTHTLPQSPVLSYHVKKLNMFGHCVHQYVLSISEGIYRVRGRHNRVKVFVSDCCLSETPHHHHPQPLLYLDGCYREGRWLITINRTAERASECGGHPHRPTGPMLPPKKPKEIGGRC